MLADFRRCTLMHVELLAVKNMSELPHRHLGIPQSSNEGRQQIPFPADQKTARELKVKKFDSHLAQVLD